MTGAPQARPARLGWAASAGDRLLPSGRAERVVLGTSAAVALAGAAAFLWRLLSWASAATPDAWAYAAWGQAVVRAECPLFELGATTPKPLAVLLGTVATPIPAERAFTVVVALAAGALCGAVFAAGHREAGGIAGAVGVIALVAAVPLTFSVVSGYADVVVAALVVAACAAAPALWMLSDLVLTGDLLATLNWSSETPAEGVLASVPWQDVPGDIWRALTRMSAVALVVLGAVGLTIRYVGARRRGQADPMPLAVVLVWSVVLAFETRYGRALNARYLLPVVGVLAVGCGFLASPLVPAQLRVRSPWPAAAAAAAGVLVAIVLTDLGSANPRPSI